jgi:adenylate cyclase
MGDVTYLGRDPLCEVQVDDVRASRRHARIDRSGDKFIVRDLGSMNGTFVNGARLLGEKSLKDGDVISIGAVRMRYEQDKKAVPRAEFEPVFPAFDSTGGDPARVRKLYERLRLFHELARAILPERDPEAMLEKLILGSRVWIDPDRAVLYLRGDGDKLEARVRWEGDSPGAEVEPSQQALDHVLAGRCTVALHGVENRTNDTIGGSRAGQRAVYGIPIVRGAQVVGVLWMEAKRVGAGENTDLELIAVLASAIAAAVEAAPTKPLLH